MAHVSSDDLILQLKKIFIWRIKQRLSDKATFRVGVNDYTKEEFIKILEDPHSTIFGQFIQKMAEDGFDLFRAGHNVGGFVYFVPKQSSENPCCEIPLDGPQTVKEMHKLNADSDD